MNVATASALALVVAAGVFPAVSPATAGSTTTTTEAASSVVVTGATGSTLSTTTTVFTGTTTTTMFVPTDVTGGGQFEGGFPTGSFDSFTFTLDEPALLVAEVQNGVGGCPGDSFVELRRPGARGDCQGNYGDDLPCVAFDDDSGPSVCSLLVKRIEIPGDYEIRVSAYSGQILRYFLDVSFPETECGNGVREPGEQCDDGNLASGDCCSSACAQDAAGTSCSDGLFCNGPDSCSGAGLCTVHAGDPCAGPDGDADCSETCSETADACSGNDPDGTTCRDGTFCNGADLCVAGACTSHAGDPCDGPDGDEDCSESCSEAEDSCTVADPNGTACDDRTFCNGGDTCAAGSCSQHAGDPCDGPDGDVDCAETCSEADDACTAADPDGSACTDALSCNGTDTCAAGLCAAHQSSSCTGIDGDADCAESCSDSVAGCAGNDPAGAPCDDGVFCNGADFCSNGSCSVHAGNPCPGPDGDGNCSESCNEAAAACTAADPAASPCDDGLFCNGADTCASGACSQHAGNPCPGADGDANCSESCSESAEACTAADANGSACSDGLFCNGADTCASGFCSNHAGDPCPGPDGDANCHEVCNLAADACSGADPAGSPCNDGIFCNGADACVAGSCSFHAGNPCDGSDGDVDCSEMCNETADACSGPDPNGTTCDDAIFCNGSDKCSGGSCSTHTGNPCTGADGDGNCAESCSETTETCTAPDIDGSTCTDGLFCNGADKCSGGSCTQHTGSPCAGADGDGDCTETCDESLDNCSAADADESACSDSVFCNGADRCSAGACTLHDGDPCAGADGDSNCAESCNETADACTAPDANGSACDDALFCNGADTCKAGACSQHAGDPCAGADGDLDCAESCDESAGACAGSDPDGSPCDDALACNGSDTCTQGLCNEHSVPDCAGADGDADCAESCSDSGAGCAGPDPEGSPCDDGLFCNGADSCAGGSCSAHAGDPCPGADSDADCSESCDESADACEADDPEAGACDDGVACNGDDTCKDGACSQHAVDACPQEGCGDATGDGEVRAADALAILRAAVGGNQCAAEPCRCDANGNGSLSATDALVVLRKAVGLSVLTSCPC
jgi:hypothetical protein